MSEDFLSNIANVSQLISLQLLLQDASNNDLMAELQRQNKEYLEKIIKNQEEIKQLLKGIKNENIKFICRSWWKQKTLGK